MAAARQIRPGRRSENTGQGRERLNNWNRFCEYRKAKGREIGITDVNNETLKDFALWRRQEKLDALRKELEEGEVLGEDEEGVSGRTLDLDVTATEKVVPWRVTEGWLSELF